MYLNLDWIKDFIDLPLSADEVAEKLLDHSCEVEQVIDYNKIFTGCVVGKVLTIEAHPNADRLSVCTVSVGDENLNIVTGAPNIALQAKVIVATIGTCLPSGLTIKETKLRGVLSEGMLCSEAELGLADQADGIIILDDQAQPGTSAAAALGLGTPLIDISIVPNRGDLLSLNGLARELAALVDRPAKSINPEPKSKPIDKLPLSVCIEAPDLCTRYMGVVLDNINIGPSPEWMQARLKSVDISPINNVVDITNYVLYELGQPLHAFSYEKLNDAGIIVRRAQPNEVIKLLNDDQQILQNEHLVIADSKGPVALAGIMGGMDSAIHDSTQTIVLESASFHPINIRRTAFNLGLRTESSQRFEKGVDYHTVETAFNQAIVLLEKYADAKIASLIEDRNDGPPAPVRIPFDHGYINRLLGTQLSPAEMIDILDKLGFKKAGDTILAPSFRQDDVHRVADLAEEVGRIYGFNRIESVLPPITHFEHDRIPPTRQDLIQQIRVILAGLGCNEILSYSMQSPGDLDRFNGQLGDILKLKNPLSSEESVLRQTLVSSLFNNYLLNSRNLVQDLNIFEIGKVFWLEKNHPVETYHAGVLLSRALTQQTQNQVGNVDIYDLKGVAENLLNQIGIKKYRFVPESDLTFLHPFRSFAIYQGKTKIGYGGQAHPGLLELLPFKRDLFFLELFIEAFDLRSEKNTYKKYALTPTVKRDYSVWIKRTISYAELLEGFHSVKADYLKDIVLADIYENPKHGLDRINLAFQFIFQNPEGTLDEQSVNQSFQNIVQSIEKNFDITYS